MFRLCCVQVSVIDDGLLKFSKLEELVLSDNQISQMCSENLPSTLKVSLHWNRFILKAYKHVTRRSVLLFYQSEGERPAVPSLVEQ